MGSELVALVQEGNEFHKLIFLSFFFSFCQVVVELDKANSAGSESDLGQWKHFQGASCSHANGFFPSLYHTVLFVPRIFT